MTVMDIEELLIFNHGNNKQEAITQYGILKISILKKKCKNNLIYNASSALSFMCWC